jgi:predicted dehydrogenase
MTRPERLRIGIVGAGLVAQVAHLPELRARPERFDVVAVADPDARARARVAAVWGIRGRHAGHGELIEAGRLDALLVCSPNATHARVAVDALEAGLHVLVEKPLCLAPDDGERISGLAAERGLVAQVGYMKRFDPAYEALLDELAGGPPPLHIATETYDPGLREPFLPSGGAAAAAPADLLSDVFLGALVHDVNLVRGVLDATGGGVERIVDAFAAERPSRAGGTVALRGGARWTMAWLHLPGLGDFAGRVVAYLADGIRSLRFPAPYLRQAPTVLRRSVGRDGVNEVTERRSWAEAYGRQLDHFHACVTAGARCRTPAADAVEDVRLLCAMHREATA